MTRLSRGGRSFGGGGGGGGGGGLGLGEKLFGAEGFFCGSGRRFLGGGGGNQIANTRTKSQASSALQDHFASNGSKSFGAEGMRVGNGGPYTPSDGEIVAALRTIKSSYSPSHGTSTTSDKSDFIRRYTFPCYFLKEILFEQYGSEDGNCKYEAEDLICVVCQKF